MSDRTRSELVEAWLKAPDVAIARGIANPSDYTADALEVLQAEALRRGIEAGTIRLPSPCEDSVYLGILTAFGRFLRPGSVFLWRHRLLTAVLVGAACRTASEALSGVVQLHVYTRAAGVSWNVVFFLLDCAAVGALCWPLRDYRGVWSVSAFFCLGILAAWVPQFAGFIYRGQIHWRPVILGLWIAIYLVFWLVMVFALSAVVFVRNRYRPVYPTGHCAKCGYDLQGLPEPRCPECGKPFELRV